MFRIASDPPVSKNTSGTATFNAIEMIDIVSLIR
jgi:hypothetical protein